MYRINFHTLKYHKCWTVVRKQACENLITFILNIYVKNALALYTNTDT